jgi:hypothetical protein
LAVGHLILEPRDCPAKGLIENRGRDLRTNFAPLKPPSRSGA